MFELTVREGTPIPLREISLPGSSLQANLAELSRKNEQLRSALRLRRGPLDLQLDGTPKLCISGIAGSLRLLGRQIEVLPKFSGEGTWHDNIMVLLSRAHGTRFDLQEVRGGLRRKRSFVDHIAQAFTRALQAGLVDGPIETYRDFQHSGYVARGQIDVRQSIAAALRTPGVIFSRTSELHADNPYNHLLHCAAEALLPLVADPTIRASLQAAHEELPDLPGPARIPSRILDRPPLQFEAYREALEIAAAVVNGRDWGLGAAVSTAFGYVVGMEQLFERFVENTVRKAVDLLPSELGALARRQVTAQFATPLTQGRRAYYTRPDNVVFVGGSPSVLVDAKYKRFVDAETGVAGRPSNSDVYQMFASMAAQQCRVALLLYPTNQDLVGSPPHWRMQIGAEPAYVSAAALSISDLRSSSDLAAMDRNLATQLMSLLQMAGGSIGNENVAA